MFNPFMTLAHCTRFAVRKAFHTGDIQHVVARCISHAPYTVISDEGLLARDDVEPGDILFTADPFDETVTAFPGGAAHLCPDRP